MLPKVVTSLLVVIISRQRDTSMAKSLDIDLQVVIKG